VRELAIPGQAIAKLRDILAFVEDWNGGPSFSCFAAFPEGSQGWTVASWRLVQVNGVTPGPSP
jgi:hypothetical protein